MITIPKTNRHKENEIDILIELGCRKRHRLTDLPDGVLAKILDHLGSFGNSLRVCRSLSRLTINHTTRASIKASRKIDLHFLDATKFSNVRCIEIDGFQPQLTNVPSFDHLEVLRWTHCAQLNDSGLLHIAQSKKLRLVHLTDSSQITGFGLRCLLMGLRYLTDLKITLSKVDGLDTDEMITYPFTLKKLSLHSPDDYWDYREEDNRKFDMGFAWLINNLPNLQCLHLDRFYCMQPYHLSFILQKIKYLKDLRIGYGFHDFEHFAAYTFNYHLFLTSLEFNFDDRFNPGTYSSFESIIIQSPHLVKLNTSHDMKWNNEGIDWLHKYATNLIHLSLLVYDINNFTDLFPKLNGLTNLDLGYCEGLDDNLSEINYMPSLRNLRIEQEDGYSSTPRAILNTKKIMMISQKFLNLTSLVLAGYTSSEEPESAWQGVSDLPNLKHLELEDMRFSKCILIHLVKNSPNIQELRIKYGEYKPEDLQSCLECLKKVERIQLYVKAESTPSNHLFDEKKTTVKKMVLSSNNGVFQGLRQLGENLPNLKILKFSMSNFSLKSLFPYLNLFSHLEELAVCSFSCRPELFEKQYLLVIVEVLPNLWKICLPDDIYNSTVKSDENLSDYLSKKGIQIKARCLLPEEALSPSW